MKGSTEDLEQSAKPARKQFRAIRLPKELVQAVGMVARGQERKLSHLVQEALEDYLGEKLQHARALLTTLRKRPTDD